jgi:hypothetical protein
MKLSSFPAKTLKHSQKSPQSAKNAKTENAISGACKPVQVMKLKQNSLDAQNVISPGENIVNSFSQPHCSI